MVRCMPKGWVIGLVAWWAASGAFGNSGSRVTILSAQMPAIEMVGNQVVKGKDYPIVVSYTTECGAAQCDDQKIRFSVTQTDNFSGCFPDSGLAWLLTTANLDDWFLGSPPNTHAVDYHNGGENFTMGEWGTFFALDDASTQSQVASLTLRNIANPPVWVAPPLQNILNVVAAYKPDEGTLCIDITPVTINTVARDTVRISGLENAPLNDQGTYTLDDVCVYSSNGWASLHFDGGTRSATEPFQLKHADNAPIPYTITVKSDSNQRGTISEDGYVEDFWRVDDTDAEGNCAGKPNMTFTIQANLKGNQAAGWYQDTMTVTVEPR